MITKLTVRAALKKINASIVMKRFFSETLGYMNHRANCTSWKKSCKNCAGYSCGSETQHFYFGKGACTHCPCNQYEKQPCNCGFTKLWGMIQTA